MMNDRFAAQLRQHLLETANERAADDQLAALDTRVTVTAQRHPLVARLNWFPGRIGPFPSVALRYGLIVLALAGATMAAAILVGNSPSRGTVFEGIWTTIDPADGSTMNLYIGRGAAPTVRFEDLFATGGACVDDDDNVFTADGAGEISGNRLEASFPNGGGCGLMTVALAGIYRYDAATDTLLDQDGVRWARVDGRNPPPTQRPATEPPATEAAEPPVTEATEPTPEPTPGQTPAETAAALECVNLAQGGTYTGPDDPLTVTATVPETPAIPWQGARDVFYLSGLCGSVAPIAFFASTATSVNDGGCMPSSAEITDFADAIARLDSPKGNDISDRIDLTIDGHPAARYDISNLSTCTGFGLWNGTILGAGETGSVYVIDVDGVLVAIELNRDGSQTQAELEEAWAIIASLQIAR